MKKLVAILALFLVGCEADYQTPPVIAQAPSQPAQLSGVRAAVDQARTDNVRNPDGPAKQAVDLHLATAQAGLPEAARADKDKSAEVSALVFAGKLEEATKRAAVIEVQLEQLKAAVLKEREQAAETLRATLAEAEARVRDAKAKAGREAYLRVVSTFATLGSAILLVGIGMVVLTTFKRLGVALIIAGPVIGGSGLLWGQKWFLITMGVGVALVGLAGGIWWAVSVYETRLKRGIK